MATRLSDEDVIDVMTDKKASIKYLCKKYKIHHKTVYKLRKGERHKHITLDPRYKWSNPMYRCIKCKSKKLTDQQVIDIITDHTTDVNVLAERYNVTRKIIQEVYAGKTYKYITQMPEYCENRRKFTCRKLTEDIVRAVKSGERTDFAAIAQEYGVTVKHIKQLRSPNNFDSWKFIPTVYPSMKKDVIRNPLTEEEVIGIISHVKEQVKVIARKYNVHPSTVSNLRTGRLKTHITLNLSLNKWLESRKNVTGRRNQNGIADQCHAQGSV